MNKFKFLIAAMCSLLIFTACENKKEKEVSDPDIVLNKSIEGKWVYECKTLGILIKTDYLTITAYDEKKDITNIADNSESRRCTGLYHLESVSDNQTYTFDYHIAVSDKNKEIIQYHYTDANHYPDHLYGPYAGTIDILKVKGDTLWLHNQDMSAGNNEKFVRIKN